MRNEWDTLKKRRSEFATSPNSKEQDYIDYLFSEGDRLQDKNRELDAFLSVEQVLAKRWEKYIELMGDDSYTELEPEEYVAKLDEAENTIHLLRRLVEDWLNQIPMTITFREKFYQIVGEPYPDWFEVPEPGLHHIQWVENNSLGEIKNE